MYSILSPAAEAPVFGDCRSAPPARAARAATPAAPAALRPHPDLRRMPLTGEHSLVFVPGHSRVAVLSQPALDLLLGHTAAGDAELSAALWQLGLAADSPRVERPPDETLSVWLHLTNACNLACSYCYIAKSAAAMSWEVARDAVDAACRSAVRHGYRGLSLKYAGGEPALALALVERTHRYARRRADELGLALNAGLLTNGTALSDEALRTMRELGIELSVSLDGLGSAHDAQRPRLGGQGSAARARSGIERAAAAGLSVNVAITVTAQSAAGLPELIGWLLERELRFTISFARGHAAPSPAEQEAIVAGMEAAFARIAETPPRWSLLGTMLDQADLSAAHARPCAAGESYLVIDQSGQVSACQMTIGQPLGHISADDPLELIRVGNLINPPVGQRPGCAGCEWRHWCAGGCPVYARRAAGGPAARPPHCPIYLRLFPLLLKVEGLRLLHWGQAMPS